MQSIEAQFFIKFNPHSFCGYANEILFLVVLQANTNHFNLSF